MNWELLISWRYLSAKRKERFISLISLISILGIALGVTALIVVISVMNGFDQELRQKIVGVNPHIIIEREQGILDPEKLLTSLAATEHVTGASSFINGQALFKVEKQVSGVLLRGIDPAGERQVTNIGQYLISGSADLSEDEIIIGSQLAKRFYLNLDDRVTIISPHRAKQFEFTVAGIFTSGMYEYDLNLVLTNIAAAQNIFNLPGAVSGIGVRLDSVYHAGSLRELLQQRLGYPYWVRDWMSLNKNLFSALQLEKTTMFVIVALIVVVACFNIAATLIMLVMEKTKDIGILKAIGATNRAIRKIFTWQGLIIGGCGTSLGLAGGVGLCHLLQNYQFIRLPEDIYYLESLPVEMRVMDLLLIVAAALLISLVATIYPSLRAGRLNPAQTLRYE